MNIFNPFVFLILSVLSLLAITYILSCFSVGRKFKVRPGVALTLSCAVPALLILHFYAIIPTVNAYVGDQTKLLLDGTYVNPKLGDTIIFDGKQDRIRYLYHKNSSIKSFSTPYIFDRELFRNLANTGIDSIVRSNLSHYFFSTPIGYDHVSMTLSNAPDGEFTYSAVTLHGDTLILGSKNKNSKRKDISYIKVSNATNRE